MRPQKTSPFSWAALSLLLTLLTAVSSWSVTLSDFTYSNGYYLIQNATDLNNLATFVNGGGSTSGRSFKQTANITLSGNFTPIGFASAAANNTIKFAGRYYGGNYKISGLTINVQDRAWPVGLFGQVSSYATIEDVYLDSPNISASGSAGGIVGINDGTIQDSKIIGGSVKGFSVGGVAEANTGTISSVKVQNVTVTSTASSSSSSTTYAGGIVGLNATNSSAKITNCEAYLVTIKGAQYTSYTGGIVGKATVGTVQYNFAIRNSITGSSNYGAIAGTSTTNGTFTGNYYNSMTINNAAKTTGVAFGDKPVKDISGKGEGVFRVILNASNVTTSGHALVSHNPEGSQDNVPYAAVGAKVYLNYTNLPSGYTATFTVNGATVNYSSGKAYFTMPSKDVTVTSATASPISYTITYKLNGGTNPSSAPTSYTPNSGTVTLPTPTKNYYTFAGWYENSSFSGAAASSINTSLVSGNLTLYAKWTPVSYTISYNLNGGTNPSNAATSYTYETAVTLPTPTRTGYTFDGWYTNSSFTGTAYTSIAITSTGNKTFYAKWSLTTYTISYVLNGGSNPSNAKTSYTYTTATFNLPTPTRTGYSFGGWYTSSSFSGSPVYSMGKGSYGDKTFYAKWTGNTYYVKFNPNNGSNITKTQTFSYGTSYALSANTFTPTTGYGSFINWNTQADGKGTSYSDKQTVSNLTTTKGATIDLYAQWKIDIATNENITVSEIADQAYTGDAITPSITVKDGITDITSSCNISYSNNTAPGVATVSISAKTGTKYEGTKTVSFTILDEKKNIANNPDITITIDDQEYTGDVLEPAVTVMDGSADVTSHFTFTYSDNIDIGIATVTISTKSTSTLYKGSTTRTFNIVAPKKDIATSADITISAIGVQNWMGCAVEPPVTVLDGTTDVTNHFDFTYSNNDDVGTATVTISAKSTSTLYKGFTTRTFTIIDTRVDISTSLDIYISPISDHLYTGQPIMPDIHIYDGANDITSFFSINYSNNTSVGEATVTISSRENTGYRGQVSIKFNIVTFVRPVANALIFNGTDQQLVTPGRATYGSVQYKMNGSDFSYTIPKGRFAGSYQVYYKVEGRDEIGVVNVVIEKAIPYITPPTAKTLTYTGKSQELVTAGYSDAGYLKYQIKRIGDSYATGFGYNIPSAINSGTYEVTYYVDESANYTGYGGTVEVTIPGTCTKNGFLTINEVDGKKHAILESNAEGAFYTDTDISVDDVTLNRTFTQTSGNKYSTLVLPFEVSTSKLSGVKSIVEFAGIGYNKTTGIKQVEVYSVWNGDMDHVTLSANKPYMIQMETSSLDIEGSVTIKETEDPIVKSGNWSFIGMYQSYIWNSSSPTFGRAYGFAGASQTNISIGEFVKVGENVYIQPMRAYLLYTPSQSMNAPGRRYAAATASINEDLPEKMDVVIVERESGEEHTTVIGTLDTRTGEFEMHRNYDLKGRKVNSTNKAHKAYYGKKVLKK